LRESAAECRQRECGIGSRDIDEGDGDSDEQRVLLNIVRARPSGAKISADTIPGCALALCCSVT